MAQGRAPDWSSGDLAPVPSFTADLLRSLLPLLVPPLRLSCLGQGAPILVRV